MQDTNRIAPATPEHFVVSQDIIAANPKIIVALELLLALPLGFGLAKLLHIGGIAWIFSGIVSGVLVLNAWRILFKQAVEPNKNSRKVGQALVGLTVGFSIAHGNLAELTSELHIFVLLTLFLLITGTIIGFIYSRASQTNILTAMLATTPGGVGIMSSIAADYEKNVSLVALVQVIRVTSVVFIIPILARILADNNASAVRSLTKNLFNFEPLNLALLALLLIVTTLAIKTVNFLRIPTGFFFGALIVGITFNHLLNWLPFIPDLDFKPPTLISLTGQALLGISIGEYWGNNPKLSKKTILYALIPVVMTIGAGFIAAAIAMTLTPWDWLTCMLVTAPGGSAEMILVSLALDHNVEIVTAAHLIRLTAINASLPLWLLLFRYIEERLPGSINNN